ncbi:hypothetical protein BN14_04196 [Rhizoctonia solani AG-1 IB]|uniref:Uncharacterized protein n=1 Tax=Thanatephorus cucumeris (strain AG1-IB / isolate 7/3/14) TaxID=1108050 RepID=M5C2R6_THACB|nr:hypothetical protein BN14_04196 [Rhizoctonia solani AG-1 IB]
MAPVLPELFSQVVYNFKTYDWSSEASNVSEKLTQATSESNVLSAVWAWFLGLFASVGALFVTSWQYIGAGEVNKEHLWEWFTTSWQSLSEFLLRPDIRNALVVWFVVFWICMLIPLAFGFGPAGVIGGSLAAWFQSVVYGAFTPAGGLFATNLKDGHQPDWNEFLNVVRPAKALLSDRAHNAVEKFGEIALSVQDNWNFVNDESRMTPRAASITRAWLMAFCVSLYAPMILTRKKNAMKGGIAAFIQSTLYGGFTPAGSIFATMTTIGTLGRESPLAIAGATVVASAIAGGMYLATN